MKRKVIASALLSIAALGVSSSASAASLASLFNVAPQNTLLSDNSAEFWIDRQAIGEAGYGEISTGDILFGVLSIGDIQGTQIGGVTSYDELTIIQANKITGRSGTFVNTQGVTMGIYSAGALDAGDAAFFDWSTGTILGGSGSGGYDFTTAFGATNDGKTLAIAYDGVVHNATRESTVQVGLTTHTDGAAVLLATLDTTFDPGDVISVFAPVNPIVAAGLVGAPNTAYSGSSFFLDGTIAQQNFPGLTFAPDITAGNGGFSTPSLASGFPIFDNIDFTVTTKPLPEPGSLALLSVGLLGLGMRRRSMKRA